MVSEKAAHRRPLQPSRVSRAPERQSWEERHIRVTFWIERTLREEVRRAASTLGTSLTQFIAQALRRAVDEVS